MPHAFPEQVTHLIAAEGYWAIALMVALESMGLPLPGELTLVAAAAYAGTTHHLDIALVIGAAAAGAIVGDNVGFWIGREIGYPVLLRFGRYVGLHESRIKLGQYLFLRFGGKVVFFGRFFALLRMLAAPLAGINRMAWGHFLAANAAGGILWATLYGLGAYSLGLEAGRLAHPVALGLSVAGVAGAAVVFILLRRHEAELAARAERALPGPLKPLHARRHPPEG